MGQAKQRGTFEQRKAWAIEAAKKKRGARIKAKRSRRVTQADVIASVLMAQFQPRMTGDKL